jgi:hypothetical protein
MTVHIAEANLHSIIESACKSFAKEIEQKGMILKMELKADHPTVQADSSRIKQVYWFLSLSFSAPYHHRHLGDPEFAVECDQILSTWRANHTLDSQQVAGRLSRHRNERHRHCSSLLLASF